MKIKYKKYNSDTCTSIQKFAHVCFKLVSIIYFNEDNIILYILPDRTHIYRHCYSLLYTAKLGIENNHIITNLNMNLKITKIVKISTNTVLHLHISD